MDQSGFERLPPQAPPPLPAWPSITPPPPRVWSVFVAYSIVFVGMFAIVMLTITLWVATHDLLRPGTPKRTMDDAVQAAMASPNFNLTLFLLISSLGGGVALCGAILSPRGWRFRLGLAPSSAGIGTTVTLVIGTLALSQAYTMLIPLLGLELSPALKTLEKTISNLDGPQLVAAVLIIGLAPGVCEELLFRGYMQTRLIERYGSMRAILISSALFGLLHLDLLQTPFGFAMGLLLGWAAYRTGSIRPAMTAHVINNSTVVLAATLLPSATGATDNAGAGIAVSVALGCALVLCACIWILHRIMPRPEVSLRAIAVPVG